MRTLRALPEALDACGRARSGGRLGLVPTMGALHEGHLSLVRRARAECDAVAVTIFVNPLQFGPGEDYAAYPRTEADDARLLQGAGADLLLLLSADEMYPPGFATRVVPSGPSERFEGERRPGHFTGVCTVVAKLLNLARPDRCYLGRKDYQQAVVVRRMAADLHLPGDVVVCDTVRDGDGLALSSRNRYLDAAQRARGLSLVAALRRAEDLFEAGERGVAALQEAMRAVLLAGIGGPPDYAAVVDPDDLSTPPAARRGDVCLLAARVGPARLLDNHVLGAKLGPFAPARAGR